MFVLRTAVLIAATMATGLVAGVCGLYQHTIMRGLARTDDRTFVSAFQAIDRAIMNPWFMMAFMGALVFTGLAAVLHFAQDVRSVLPWLITAFVLYLITFGITMAVNVPLNEAIKAAGDPAGIADLGEVRRQFDEARWSGYNLVRTITTTVAFGVLCWALVISGNAD
ncbi:anthrone oxygenase family protein [Nonomuraea sp. B10E15]|uniref:anthrone oxygenase family protein n=1 Tax=Nonomuraea sp. B10E15 TaxID=3153560 RepID=UPI00325EC70A